MALIVAHLNAGVTLVVTVSLINLMVYVGVKHHVYLILHTTRPVADSELITVASPNGRSYAGFTGRPTLHCRSISNYGPTDTRCVYCLHSKQYWHYRHWHKQFEQYT